MAHAGKCYVRICFRPINSHVCQTGGRFFSLSLEASRGTNQHRQASLLSSFFSTKSFCGKLEWSVLVFDDERLICDAFHAIPNRHNDEASVCFVFSCCAVFIFCCSQLFGRRQCKRVQVNIWIINRYPFRYVQVLLSRIEGRTRVMFGSMVEEQGPIPLIIFKIHYQPILLLLCFNSVFRLKINSLMGSNGRHLYSNLIDC